MPWPKGRPRSVETRERMSISQRRVVHTPEWNARVSFSKTGRVVPRLSEDLKSRWRDPEYRARMHLLHKGSTRPEATRRKMSLAFTRRGTKQRTPSAPELELMKLVNDTVEYTGLGKFWVYLPGFKGGRHKSPDFVVRPFSESKIVIEVFGGRGFYHTEEEAVELVEAYSQVGIECVLLWEHEIERIRELKPDLLRYQRVASSIRS